MEREVSSQEAPVASVVENPFAAAWGEVRTQPALPMISQPEYGVVTDSLETIQTKIEHDKLEFAQFLSFLSSLSTATRGMLNLGHMVGACVCHGGAVISQAGKAGLMPGVAVPFHYHADGSVHYEEHEPTDKGLFALPQAVKRSSTRRTRPPSNTAHKQPRPFIAENTRGIGHLFEPNFVSIGLQQLLVS